MLNVSISRVLIATATTAAASTTAATATAAATVVAATAAISAATTAAAISATTAAVATSTATAAVAATTTAAAALLARLGFVDAERATIKVLAVHRLHGLGALFGGAHRHECEAARAARLAIGNEMDVGDGSKLLKGAADGINGCVEGKIADVQTSGHCSCSIQP
jgi:hypothetical protein